MGEYGRAPLIVGNFEIEPKEMMFWLNLPIKMPNGPVVMPPNLDVFKPIVNASCEKAQRFLVDYEKHYVYITAKNLYFDAGQNVNRPGWHCDGFLTDDINFIWSNTDPTIFWHPEEDCGSGIDLPPDHEASLEKMSRICSRDGWQSVYPGHWLILLDQYVIHRCPVASKDGVRCFVKISFSKNRYDMEGNSINHLLDYKWDYVPRQKGRNIQSSQEGGFL